MVQTWLADIRPLLEEEVYRACYQAAPEFRQKKADRLKKKTAKAQSIGVWSLWEYVRRQQNLAQNTVFNLSHSKDHVLVAYSDREGVQVGCDVEQIQVCKEAVARRFFCPEEYRHLMEAKPQERDVLFYRYWVLKESFIKATRRGMALGLDTFEIDLQRGESPVLVRRPEEFPEAYFYQEYQKEGVNAAMAVCTTDPEIDAVLHILDWQKEGWKA